jgi:hypothetical protein
MRERTSKVNDGEREGGTCARGERVENGGIRWNEGEVSAESGRQQEKRKKAGKEDCRCRRSSNKRRTIGATVTQTTKAATMAATSPIPEEARRVDAPLFCFAGAVRSAVAAFEVPLDEPPPRGTE